MMNTLKEMLVSKKFIAAVAGVIVALVSKLGIELDTISVMAIITPIISYIVGQGIADAGKEKAKVESIEKKRVADKLFEEATKGVADWTGTERE